METPRDQLEPIDAETAVELFIDHKEASCSEATVRAYSSRMSHLVQWCGQEDVDNLNDLTGRNLQEYRLWRRSDGDLKTVTVNQQMCTLRVFLKWAASIDAVPENLYEKLLIPRVPTSEQHRDETLEAERAEDLLEHLDRYAFASREHALLALLWETGLRISGVAALDLDDFLLSENALTVVHRPDTGTALKNGTGGERMIALSPELTAILREYVTETRPDQTEESGREPLFTTQTGRMSRTTMRRTVYKITSPCYRNEECPDCTGKPGHKCGTAVMPHSIRRGSITHFLSKDVPAAVISDRMDVSRDVMDKHYDSRSEKVKLEQRRGYLDQV